VAEVQSEAGKFTSDTEQLLLEVEERLERVVMSGVPVVASVRALVEAPQFIDGEGSWRVLRSMLEVVDPLLKALEGRADVSDPDVLSRARSLCADLMQLPIDGNIANHNETLREMQREARSLLTGEPRTEVRS
jgi:hypothetical protein